MNRMPKVQENLVEKNNLEDPDHMTHLDPEMIEEFKKSAVEDDLIDEVIEDEEQIVERVKLDNNDIFKTKKLNKNVEISAPVVEKVKKPKRKISDEHRERLRLGREKALANRRAKAKNKLNNIVEKKEAITDDGDTLAQEQSDKDFDDSFTPENLNNIVEKTNIKPVEIIKEKIIEKGLSKEEIIEITTNASRKVLEENELKRKERKAKKIKIKEAEEKNNNINSIIRKATTRGVDPNNPFHMCY